MRVLLLILYFAAPLAPAAALFAGAPFLRDPPGRAAAFTAGLFAYTWLCLQVVLAARPRFLDRAFGLDRVLRFHGGMGLAALAVAAAHVGLVGEAAGPQGSTMRELGGIGWSVLLAVVVLAVLFLGGTAADRVRPLRAARAWTAARLRLTFERARRLHNLSLAAVTLLCAHIVLLPVAGLRPFKALVAALCALALACHLHHKVLRPLRLRRRPWTVEAVEPESPRVCSLVLRAPEGAAPRRDPGQFVFVRLHDPAVPPEEHPFTVASSALEPGRIRLTIRAVGDYTRALPRVAPGARAEVAGPYGRFTYRRLRAGAPLVFLAGGIGVTPFLAMLRTLRREDPGRRVTLMWGARTSADLVAADALLAAEREMPDLHVIPVLSREANGESLHGRIDAARVRALVAGSIAPASAARDPGAVFFVCGPGAFVRDVVRALRAAGVPRGRVLVERFAL